MSSRSERSRRLAPSFLLLVNALSCSTESGAEPPDSGSAGDTHQPREGGPPYRLRTPDDSCPTELPSADASCSGAVVCGYESESCAYYGINAACVEGAWKLWLQDGACNPPSPQCPGTPPPRGGLCFEADECTYGVRDVSCVDGRWGETSPDPGGAGGSSAEN